LTAGPVFWHVIIMDTTDIQRFGEKEQVWAFFCREDIAPLSYDLDLKVQQIFNTVNHEREFAGLSPLVNGTILTVKSIEDGTITCEKTEYRRFIAQRQDPSLFQTLQIRPLAVGGIVSTNEGILISQRGAGGTQCPGYWEMMPAGSVRITDVAEDGTIDMEGALAREALHEAGIEKHELTSISLFQVYEMPGDHVIEVRLQATCTLSAEAIRDRFKALSRPEHTSIAFVPRSNISRFCDPERRPVVSTTLAVARDLILAR